ncbi:unnamed protein product, partial [Ectocarpus sp. 12 AP-2014]
EVPFFRRERRRRQQKYLSQRRAGVTSRGSKARQISSQPFSLLPCLQNQLRSWRRFINLETACQERGLRVPLTVTRKRSPHHCWKKLSSLSQPDGFDDFDGFDVVMDGWLPQSSVL